MNSYCFGEELNIVLEIGNSGLDIETVLPTLEKHLLLSNLHPESAVPNQNEENIIS